MNPILTNPDFTKEFVMTPEPNAYLVGLKLSAEQAAPFDGHDFLSICVVVDEDGSGAGVAYVYDVLPNGDPGQYRVEGADINEAQGDVLIALEERCHTAVTEFYDAVADDLDEYYAEVRKASILSQLNSLLGEEA